MRRGSAGIVVLAVLGVLLVGGCSIGTWVMHSYNNLVTLDQDVDAKWAQVENQYQRRFDLIPNLMETTKAYAKHERETFTAVTEARAKVGQINLNASNLSSQNLKNFQGAQDALSGALSRLMVVMERYPELKADANFRQFMDELAGTENRIAVARRDYNGSAQMYNTAKKRFPMNMLAGFFYFSDKPYFKAEEGANKVPKVDFSGPAGGK